MIVKNDAGGNFSRQDSTLQNQHYRTTYLNQAYSITQCAAHTWWSPPHRWSVFEGRLRAGDSFQDVVGFGVPNEGVGALIVSADVVADDCDELFHILEDAAVGCGFA